MYPQHQALYQKISEDRQAIEVAREATEAASRQASQYEERTKTFMCNSQEKRVHNPSADSGIGRLKDPNSYATPPLAKKNRNTIDDGQLEMGDY